MFGKKKKKQDYYDDGRTIFSMNVEGMPDYVPRIDPPMPQAEPLPVIDEEGNDRTTENEEWFKRQQMMKNDEWEGKTFRRFVLSATLAGILVSLVFVGCGALFILFCQHIWLH